ncbi:Hypothetical_protein [Hexamita inflata]|uniref:Hypothetical_protein n=1 Tax=Hexamita inflata TaxID=28002 RepID=A0ABP1GUJ4_9EUKA
MYIAQKTGIVNLFIYNNKTQQSTIEIAIDNVKIHTFALFGLNKNNQHVVMDSLINVTLKFEVFRSGLLCIQCDATINNSTLIYIASGQQISGLLLQALTSVVINYSFIQYRITSLNSSGFVSVIDNNITFIVSDTKLSGANLIYSEDSGYISSTLEVNIILEISRLIVCVNSISRFGSNSILIDIVGNETYRCDICGSEYVAYGLCVDNLQFGEVNNGIMLCINPFEYVDNQCVCSYGHIFNVTKCVNVLELISKINSEIENQDIQYFKNQIDNITNKLLELDESILNNISLVTQNIRIENTNIESYILSNYTKFDLNLAENSSVLDLRIYNNITALNNSLISSASVLNSSISSLNNTIEQQKNIISQLIQLINCTNNVGFQIVDGFCVQIFCKYLGQISINGICQCLPGYALLDDSCVRSIHSIISQIPQMSCTKNVYINTYDIAEISHSITDFANFSSGYAFPAITHISQAYINVHNCIFPSNVVPLFQSQSTFINIKVQIESQTVNGGAILSNSNDVVINSVNIISAPYHQLTIGAGFQLNIIQSASSSASINNLLVNLSFAMSQGNITLIGSVCGVMNITGYQILGVYQSTSCMAMITLTMTSATLNVTQLNFMPSEYNSGNSSSYTLSSVSSSTVSFSSVSVVLGNETYSQVANSIASAAGMQYQFGGIINVLNNSNISVIRIIYDSKQIFNSQCIKDYGLILGQTQQTLNQLVLQSICVSQNISQVTYIWITGLIGQFSGNYSIQQASVSIEIQGTYVSYFGVVAGVQTTQCVNAEVINFRSMLNTIVDLSNLSSTNNNIVSGFFGYQYALNCSVQNSTVLTSNITAQYHAGGFCGYAYLTNFSILNSTVLNSSIKSSQNYTGGFVGRSFNFNFSLINSSIIHCNISSQQYSAGGYIGQMYSSQIYISFSTIQNVRISSPNYVGIVLGCDNGLTLSGSNTYSIVNSQSFGYNYINGVIQTNCVSFSNAWSQYQC